MGAFNTALAPVVDRWVEEQKGNFDAPALVEAATGRDRRAQELEPRGNA